ncbi:polysaccharide biosynthesis protein [Desulfatitalea tepidiphila]|uniref:polysaccharide biosynthesis protein n=1 Tax=Desulfatitalea tepidiphila TaxID=1185843 RepID=UPI0009789766|nr:nucleoside-diphosphate sugar epimerase/dehydratase [Desulfatitalea tepidiphila]
MLRNIRNINFWMILFADVALFLCAHVFAYLVRFEGTITTGNWYRIWTVVPWLVAGKLVVFYWFGLYQGMWRYSGIVDMIAVFKAAVLVSVLAVSAMLMMNRFQGFSRSVFVLDGVFTFLFACGLRFSVRMLHQKYSLGESRKQCALPASAKKRILILGAGDAGEKVAREVLDNQALPYQIVGFLDDDPGKIGRRMHGLPVLGAIEDVCDVAGRIDAQELLIAIPSAGREQINRVVELCRNSGVVFKTLPGMGEIIDNKVSIRSIREVSYKDLLGRPPVRLENDRIRGLIKGRTILVTGAGGSIGSELCRQILRFEPGLMLFMDSSEENLYRIEMEVLHERGFKNYVTVLGKVQDRELLESVFYQYRPSMVFHAAAYKHVPLVEKNPWEAVYNNIFASHRLIQASIRYEVGRFILVSTDKAVRPTNVMGASKRLTEMLMEAHCLNSPTKFMAVRFGNVLGSSGSVIPLFRRQVEKGGPVTVTHPEITRYFMSIEEAAQLILQAASMGEGGEIFILEMGTPVRIDQMARDFIRLCGKEPDTEIEIKYVGLRPGEKLYEELITEGEGIVPTSHQKIMVLKGRGEDMKLLRLALDRLKRYASLHDAQGIKDTLKSIIPEYTPQTTEAVLECERCENTLMAFDKLPRPKTVSEEKAGVARPLETDAE